MTFVDIHVIIGAPLNYTFTNLEKYERNIIEAKTLELALVPANSHYL